MSHTHNKLTMTFWKKKNYNDTDDEAFTKGTSILIFYYSGNKLSTNRDHGSCSWHSYSWGLI